eukprot:GHRR01010122.1.p1 GENE.GHRR01010122.1~~GHRR01010122.1.p1  ORF type:complete len:131 (+),score=8.46 GHRR01010122.1:658-1050(+)
MTSDGLFVLSIGGSYDCSALITLHNSICVGSCKLGVVAKFSFLPASTPGRSFAICGAVSSISPKVLKYCNRGSWQTGIVGLLDEPRSLAYTALACALSYLTPGYHPSYCIVCSLGSLVVNTRARNVLHVV